MRSARITGWGTALPDKVVTNADLEAMLDTSDEWIVERSGIRERRIGGTTAALAVTSGAKPRWRRPASTPSDIDLLILCTTTPDQQVPATSAVVQHELGLACGAFDINAACSGFVYGLVTASPVRRERSDPARAPDRLGDAVAHHRLGRSLDGGAVRRWRRRGRDRGNG